MLCRALSWLMFTSRSIQSVGGTLNPPDLNFQGVPMEEMPPYTELKDKFNRLKSKDKRFQYYDDWRFLICGSRKGKREPHPWLLFYEEEVIYLYLA
mmetsp:Transcript_51814/g.125063  ORF Transcript_51814/g.125063 Transcript_51814/m.125063 type:complete len:96 (-) Transcript_51814:987-1274(-)